MMKRACGYRGGQAMTGQMTTGGGLAMTDRTTTGAVRS